MIRGFILPSWIFRSQKCRFIFPSLSTSGVCLKKESKSVAAASSVKKSFLEDNRKDYENTFGIIDSFERVFSEIREDPEDVLDYKRAKAAKGKTTIEYIKEIKSYLSQNDYKNAIKVLEVDMVNDKKPLNRLIYKILICYNAKIGNLVEAYRLFIRYKSRQGRVTGAMYTSMFNACANCKNSLFALEKANAVRECMNKNKLHSVNISNYNAMLKAYGRHGDIANCLKIMDEVLERRDKVRVETYSFLLQACISDRNSGLRHALILWRKMIQNRLKPQIYSFNLMLRCVRDCSLGDVMLLPNIIQDVMQESRIFFRRKVVYEKIDGETKRKVLKIPTDRKYPIKAVTKASSNFQLEAKKDFFELNEIKPNEIEHEKLERDEKGDIVNFEEPQKEHSLNNIQFSQNIKNESSKSAESCYNKEEKECEKVQEVSPSLSECELPNLLALEPSVGSVIKLGAMREPHYRFMLLGGVQGFFKTMDEFEVKPTIKTFTLLLDVIPSTLKAEQEIMSLMENYNLRPDTAFFNVILKKRIFRNEDFLIKPALEQMHALGVKPDLLTFSTLACGCRTCELGMELIQSIRNQGFRLSSSILSNLLRQAKNARDLNYALAILQAAKEDDVKLCPKFLAELGCIIRREKRFRTLNKEEINELSFEAENIS